ncbi:MAG: ImmA/IrrE family metallo-endopeptidase [Pirellulales bacterium]|nr:ImmA/IrrE family metallo-endopeptidase [Pirellulales bacterium]
MLPELAPEEIATSLDAVAMEVLDEAGVDRPPVDAFGVAAALGIAVALDDCQHGRARYVRLKGYRSPCPRATILLRPEPRPERKHWAVAHEIGEHVAHRVFARLGADPCTAAGNARELVANHLAGRLLLPGAWFEPDACRCGWDLLTLKARYATASHELIARRMLECRPPVIITIFDHGRLYFRRSNLPGRAPSLSPVERQCWETVHRRNRPQDATEGTRAVRGWPVHEEGWKREVLRTEVEDFGVDAG